MAKLKKSSKYTNWWYKNTVSIYLIKKRKERKSKSQKGLSFLVILRESNIQRFTLLYGIFSIKKKTPKSTNYYHFLTIFILHLYIPAKFLNSSIYLFDTLYINYCL